MARYRLTVNGKQHDVNADPDEPLLYVLRDDLRLRGPKFGCGLSQCGGACTVLIDGKATPSCVYPVAAVQTQQVVSVEGLPAKFRDAFTEEHARSAVTAYGNDGAGRESAARYAPPTDEQIRHALNGNLCALRFCEPPVRRLHSKS